MLDCAGGKIEPRFHCQDNKREECYCLLMQIGIKLKKKHLAHCSAGQYTSRVIHSLYGNMVDEFATPCPDLEDYYAWERNILFLLSLIMNRFAASTRGSPLKGILAGCNLDRWRARCCTHYWKRQAQTQSHLRILSKVERSALHNLSPPYKWHKCSPLI